jgi:hypothetical protein
MLISDQPYFLPNIKKHTIQYLLIVSKQRYLHVYNLTSLWLRFTFSSLRVFFVLPLKHINNKTPIQNRRQVCMTNHRSITLLTAFLNYWKRSGPCLHTNSIPVPEKFGFRKDACTENAAAKLTASTVKATNQKKMHVLGIFCALGKPTDCIVPRTSLKFRKIHCRSAHNSKKSVPAAPRKLDLMHKLRRGLF